MARTSERATRCSVASPTVIQRLTNNDTGFLALLAGAALLFYSAPWPALYVPALVLVIILSWLRLDLALALVILAAPFFMAPKQIGTKQFAPSEVFLTIDVAVFLGRLAFLRQNYAWARLRRSLFTLPAVLLVAVVLVSTAASAEKHLALRAFTRVALEPTLFYGLLCLVSSKRTMRTILIVSVLGAGAGMAGLSVVQLFTGQNLTQAAGSSIPRVTALYGSADNLGLLLDRVIPLCFALALAVRRHKLDWLAWALLLLLLVILFFTSSQGAWVGVVVGCLLIIALYFPWGRWIAAISLVVALLAIAAGGPRLVHAVRAGHANTIQQRLHIWHSSLKMLRDHPLLGVGPDNFGHYYAPPHQPYNSSCRGLGYMDPEAYREPCLSHPHDVVLDFLLSAGVLGLISFLWLEAVFWRLSIRLWRVVPRGIDSAITLGVMGAMIASLVHGLVDNSYFLSDLALFFWLYLAWCVFGEESEPSTAATSLEAFS